MWARRQGQAATSLQGRRQVLSSGPGALLPVSPMEWGLPGGPHAGPSAQPPLALRTGGLGTLHGTRKKRQAGRQGGQILESCDLPTG